MIAWLGSSIGFAFHNSSFCSFSPMEIDSTRFEVSPSDSENSLLPGVDQFFCFVFQFSILSQLWFSSWHWAFSAYLFMSDLALGGVTRVGSVRKDIQLSDLKN